MKRIFKFITANLLGVSVAIGVCSFIFDAFIAKSHHFILTQFSGVLIFLVARYIRYKENSAFRAEKRKNAFDRPINRPSKQ